MEVVAITMSDGSLTWRGENVAAGVNVALEPESSDSREGTSDVRTALSQAGLDVTSARGQKYMVNGHTEIDRRARPRASEA